MRMFGPAGNPQAWSLFKVIGRLQQREGLRLKVQAVRLTASLPAAKSPQPTSLATIRFATVSPRLRAHQSTVQRCEVRVSGSLP